MSTTNLNVVTTHKSFNIFEFFFLCKNATKKERLSLLLANNYFLRPFLNGILKIKQAVKEVFHNTKLKL